MCMFVYVGVKPGVVQLLPDLFFKAADLAGVYGVAVLYGVLPPLMVWLLRLQQVLPLLYRLSNPPRCNLSHRALPSTH